MTDQPKRTPKHDCEYISNPESGKCDICYEIADAVEDALRTERQEVERLEEENKKLDKLAYMEGEPGHETTWKEEAESLLKLLTLADGMAEALSSRFDDDGCCLICGFNVGGCRWDCVADKALTAYEKAKGETK